MTTIDGMPLGRRPVARPAHGRDLERELRELGAELPLELSVRDRRPVDGIVDPRERERHIVRRFAAAQFRDCGEPLFGDPAAQPACAVVALVSVSREAAGFLDETCHAEGTNRVVPERRAERQNRSRQATGASAKVGPPRRRSAIGRTVRGDQIRAELLHGVGEIARAKRLL